MSTAIKAIKTEQDHNHAVAHLLQLMATGSDEHNQTIELLAELIQDYELKISPSPVVDPIDAIRLLNEQSGTTDSSCNAQFAKQK